MPSTIVKLSSTDARAWARNQPLWLNTEGDVERSVTKEEQAAISRALERTHKVNQSFRTTLPLLQPKHSNSPSVRRTVSRKPVEVMEFAFEVEFIGQKRVVTVFHGELRYATGREVLAARLLADHGECVLHGRAGKCIAVLRDPLLNERPPNLGKRVQFSRNPEDEARKQVSDAEHLRGTAPTRRPQARSRARIGAGMAVRSPQECPNDCRGFRSGDAWVVPTDSPPLSNDQHNPMCMHAGPWAKTLAKKAGVERHVLYDLDTSQPLRDADAYEIALAHSNEQKLGARQIEVSGKVYAVLSETDANAAAAEARGESPQLAPSPDYAIGESPASADLGDDGEDVSTAAAGSNTERSGWPTLDEIMPSEAYKERAEITARTYLSRKTRTASAAVAR